MHAMCSSATHSGICGTDFKIYSGAIPVRYPRIMGHEMIGEVVEGGDAAGFRPGDRVIVDPELYCGACFHCRIGQTHLCPKGMLLGRDANGGFAEYVAPPASHVFHLPDSVDSRTAPLIQVLTTCLHAQRQINIFPPNPWSLDRSHGTTARATALAERPRSLGSHEAWRNATWPRNWSD
jgi:threonine dehydrogenase-like Zn-dependent dehydrogenase